MRVKREAKKLLSIVGLTVYFSEKKKKKKIPTCTLTYTSFAAQTV